MGAIKFFSSNSLERNGCESHPNLESSRKLPNPDPSNYRIIRHEKIGKFLVIEIKYPDCTNYEGRKVMIFTCSLDELLRQHLIDPHFSGDNTILSPIARFEPTEQGWNYACNFCKQNSHEK